jgi:protoporphyrin/coproporphyrin ferrochelatase
MKTGLLLANLGTPDDASPAAVRRYLAQFLSDPRVLDIGAVGRWLLLHLFILPTRPSKSAAAYAKIWGPDGSPLLVHSRALQAAVQARLGAGWQVELGMRYGQPSIETALERLRAEGVDRVVFFPLYPQYASSSTGSSIEELYRVIGARWVTPAVSTVEAFYDDAGFVRAFAEAGRPVIEREAPDHVLFSYHGLPERQVLKTDDTGAHCLKSERCCDAIVEANRNCYRAQCFATTRALVAALGLTTPHSVSFQSRLGRTPWIQPYTDKVLPELYAKGVRKLVVFCPAFVADCLETLEEIGIRAQSDWIALGGASLALVPSLNASPPWVEAVCALARAKGEPDVHP